MKVILYMATTPNGMIARKNDDSDFISGEAWKEYLRMVKRCGNIIIGRRTFEVCVYDQHNFPFPNALNVVMSSRKIRNRWPKQAVITDKSPKQIVSMLKRMGFDSAFLAGGAGLNSSFMKQGLVDGIYLDVIPHMLGAGISLFASSNFESRLRLIGTRKLSPNIIQLHYKVLKHGKNKPKNLLFL